MTLDQIIDIATNILMTNGEHIALVIVEVEDRFAFVPIEMPDHDRPGYFFMAGVLSGDALKQNLESCFFISEAWMSEKVKGESLEVPPSQDPNRIEVLIVAEYRASSGAIVTVSLKMLRDGQGQLTGLAERRAMNIEGHNYLLEAFVKGYNHDLQGSKPVM